MNASSPTSAQASAPLPTYFISHGGGPWPYMDDAMRPMYAQLEASLKAMPEQLGVRPRAVLMISGHWEERAFTVMANAHPPMVYDYYGFPKHTYQVRYSAAGDPALAQRVHELIAAAGLPAGVDDQRGFDHGAFVPMAVMYPLADMPMIQLSLRATLDPSEHLALGRALAPLRNEGVLIVGSGLSYHNLRLFGPGAKAPSEAFDGWLQETMAAAPAERSERLIRWADAPAARYAHPREEHLLPLMAVVGAAEQEESACVYHEEGVYGGVAVSSFRIGAAPTV